MKRYLLILFFSYASLCQANEIRFPIPTSSEIEEAHNGITARGKDEITSLPFNVLMQFLWDRYIRGPSRDFHYYGSNPIKLSQEQAQLPATIFLHSSSSNQAQWLPLLHSIENYQAQGHLCGPLFTFNFDDKTVLAQLIQTIENIRRLYFEAGATEVNIHLVGHSLGAMAAAEYAFNTSSWIENTTVKKVIAIAGRFKNIEPPSAIPFYPYCHDMLEHVDQTWEKIQQNRGVVEFYTIAAANDWLIPQESALVGDSEEHNAVIPNKGHILVAYSHAARHLVIKWLYQDKL